ncbi:MAG: hypothetical protein WA432_00470 [Candidatus Babeliaceae bacterium]
MILSKVFPLSLLLVSSLSLARVQLDTQLEIVDASHKRIISAKVQLDVNETVVFDRNCDDLSLEMQLLSENEEGVHVQCNVYDKNAEGIAELIACPEIFAVYDKNAELLISNSDAESFKMTLIAKKV